MPLHILGPMVVIGIAGIVVILHLLGLSRTRRFDSEAEARAAWEREMDAPVSRVILCHNHPSGQLRPSAEDIQLTRKLVEGGRFLEIQVQDHLIVTNAGYFSFADNGQLN